MSSPKKLALQKRRLHALELHARGWKGCHIAQALHVSTAAVSQWLAMASEHGTNGLLAKTQTGAPKKLSPLHTMMLSVLLHGKPREFGLDADTWNRTLVKQTIHRLFGVEYTLQHVGRLIVATKKRAAPQVKFIAVEELTQQRSVAEIKQLIRKNLHARKYTD